MLYVLLWYVPLLRCTELSVFGRPDPGNLSNDPYYAKGLNNSEGFLSVKKN